MHNTEINITDILTLIVDEAIRKTPIFQSYDINKIIIAGSTNRKNSQRGTFSKLIPLRFKNGASITRYKEENYCIPRVVISNIEILYIMYFYMPSFHNLSALDKIKIIFHELYHISPEFNGDIRRMGSRKFAHGHSGEKFKQNYEDEAERFYEDIISDKYKYFLEMNIDKLKDSFKKLKIRKIEKPRAVKMSKKDNLHESVPHS